jgi:hypothetical protein
MPDVLSGRNRCFISRRGPGLHDSGADDMRAPVFRIIPEQQTVLFPCKTRLQAVPARAGKNLFVFVNRPLYQSFLEFAHGIPLRPGVVQRERSG